MVPWPERHAGDKTYDTSHYYKYFLSKEISLVELLTKRKTTTVPYANVSAVVDARQMVRSNPKTPFRLEMHSYFFLVPTYFATSNQLVTRHNVCESYFCHFAKTILGNGIVLWAMKEEMRTVRAVCMDSEIE